MDSWLQHLVDDDPRARTQHVEPALAIDVPARNARQEDLLTNYRNINKGLSMELLVALSLRHLDKPEYVQSMCCVAEISGHPNNCAPSGHPDVVSYYKTPDGQNNFYILSEVSAMSRMSEEDYRGQLKQALSHANKLIDEEEENVIVYALVINEAYSDVSTETKGSQFKHYRAFKKEHELTNNSTVRVIPLNSQDFIVLMDQVNEYCNSPPVREHLESWVVEDALRETHNLLHQRHTPAEAKWIMQSLIDRLTAGHAQQLEFDERNDAEDEDH